MGGEDDADGVVGDLAVAKLADFVEVGTGIGDPIEPGEPGVDDPGFDVGGDLLGAEEDRFDLEVVDHGLVGARIDFEMEAGTCE